MTYKDPALYGPTKETLVPWVKDHWSHGAIDNSDAKVGAIVRALRCH